MKSKLYIQIYKKNKVLKFTKRYILEEKWTIKATSIQKHFNKIIYYYIKLLAIQVIL